MSKKLLGIVAFTREKAEQYARKHYIPSDLWYYIPVSEKISGIEAKGIIIDELEEALL